MLRFCFRYLDWSFFRLRCKYVLLFAWEKISKTNLFISLLLQISVFIITDWFFIFICNNDEIFMEFNTAKIMYSIWLRPQGRLMYDIFLPILILHSKLQEIVGLLIRYHVYVHLVTLTYDRNWLSLWYHIVTLISIYLLIF